MSGYTSGNNAPTQMAQAPNRKGNISKDPAKHNTGVTAVTRPQGSLYTPDGSQGAPAFAKVGNNKNAGATSGRGQKVMVTTHCDYDGRIKNDGYMNSDRNNFLK
jgi:hypothetical protein